jgi:hypothetical protein
MIELCDWLAYELNLLSVRLDVIENQSGGTMTSVGGLSSLEHKGVGKLVAYVKIFYTITII